MTGFYRTESLREALSFQGIMKQSAGTLLYRTQSGQLEVLLVYPSRSYNHRAPWSIPKGIPDDGEGLEPQPVAKLRKNPV